VKYASDKPKSGSLRTFCNDGLMRNVEKFDGCADVEEGWRKGRKRSKQDLGGFVADEEGVECGSRDDNPEGEVALEQISSRV
jgi:hypothetical protein